jgi:hypothetical protein
MARQDALSIVLANGSTPDKLAETYAEIIDKVQKGALSSILKNTNLSGDPTSGSVEVRRLRTSTARAYGTARSAGAGDLVQNVPVIVNIDTDKEIVEEIERKDIKLYGVDGILAKRANNQKLSMISTLDTAFFTEAESAGTDTDVTGGSTYADKLELLINAVETTSNANVDGVDRSMIVVTLKPETYGKVRNHLDTLPNPVDGGVAVATFHGVRVYSNHRQTEDAICMVEGAIAQPVTSDEYQVEKINLGNAFAVSLFFSFGTQAVMADLIRYADFEAVSA